MDNFRVGLRGPMPGWHHNKSEKMSAGVSSPESAGSPSGSEQSRSPSDEVMSTTTVSRRSTGSFSLQAGGLREVYMSIRNNLRLLDEYTYTDKHFDQLTCEVYRDYVANERLVRMPTRGSFWDRSLRSARIFGENLWNFGVAIEPFCSDSTPAAATGLACCKTLLQIDNNSKALVPTFYTLNELALLVSRVTHIEEIFTHEASKQARYNTVELFSRLISLVGDIAIYYKKRIDGVPNGSVRVQFESIFGEKLAHLGVLTDKIVDDVWKLKLGHKLEGLEKVRDYLRDAIPTKPSLRAQIDDTMGRAEDSCEWFKSLMSEFFRGPEKLLTVTGPAGSGKTVLALWVKERLQQPLDRKLYSSLRFTFPFDSPKDATVLSFLKNIAWQLLELNAGDVSLYEQLAKTFYHFRNTKDRKALESGLWASLDAGFATARDHRRQLVLVIDAFDELPGSIARSFYKTLKEHIDKYETTQAIVLSRPVPYLDNGNKHVSLTRHRIEDDIRSFLRQQLSALEFFKSLNETSKDLTVEDLVQKADGSFLWATISSDLLSQQSSTERFTQTSKALKPGLDNVLQKHLNIGSKTTPAARLLTFMLTAERSLGIDELSELIRLDTEKQSFGPSMDPAKELWEHCNGITIVRDGRAHFKGKPIRDFVRSLMGKSLPAIKEAHLQMVLRLVLYAKLSLTEPHEPSLDEPDQGFLDRSFKQRPLLEFTVTSWLYHFQSSPLLESGSGQPSLSAKFKALFPDSASLALLEQQCWKGITTEEQVERHRLALRIREISFQGKGISTLQTAISLASIYMAVPEATTAARLFYYATTLSLQILPDSSNTTVLCATRFLQVTEPFVFTQRDELATGRIRTIELMIEVCKAKHGSHSRSVLKWYQELAEMYINLSEEHNAALTYKTIYEIVVALEGRDSNRAKGIAERFGGLNVVLKGESDKPDIREVEDILLETSETVDGADTTSIDIRMRLASLYISQKSWVLAENTLIALWRSVSQALRTDRSNNLRISQLQISVEYAKLLSRLKRDEEAHGVVLCAWAEYENQDLDDIAMAVRVRELGELFKSFGYSTAALAVFSKVQNWFKSNGKMEDREGSKTTSLITEVSEHVTKMSTLSTTTSTSTWSVSTEAILTEIYETHYARCKSSGSADAAFFGTFFTLLQLYWNSENWAKAEIHTRQALAVSWGTFLESKASSLRLAPQFTDENLKIARYLAMSYRHQGKVREAGEIYYRIFRACLSSLDSQNKLIQESTEDTVTLYQQQGRQDMVIKVYQDLLGKYRQDLGATHKSTINLLYELAFKCGQLGRKEEEIAYYEEILASLNRSQSYCHTDAFKAAWSLINYYDNWQSWKKLQNVASLLWGSFVHHNEACKLDESQVELLYARQKFVLDTQGKAGNSTEVYKLSREFYEASSAVFGASAEIVFRAMVAFAGVCERDEKHYQEAASVYEELIQRSSSIRKSKATAISESDITQAKKRLFTVYLNMIAKSSSTSTATIERSIELAFDEYTDMKTTLGLWHESTLSRLKDIVQLYTKLNTQASHGKPAQLLQSHVISIVTSSSVTTTELFGAGTTLADIYLSVNMAEEARILAKQLQHFFVLGNSFGTTGTTLQLDKAINKDVIVFLAAMDQYLTDMPGWTYSEAMATRLLEKSLYNQYARATETEAGIETILKHGGKLRALWLEPSMSDHKELVTALDERLSRLFMTKYAKYIDKEQSDAVYELYSAIIQSLGESQSKIDFATLVCRAGNERAMQLLDKGEFKRAHQTARCIFNFGHKQLFYHAMHRIHYGYRLAEYMAGIDVRSPADAGLRDEMAKTSRSIMSAVLGVFKGEGIEFVRLKFQDLAGIVRLLGTQQDYDGLEHILLSLWHSREVRGWPPALVLRIGTLLVHAHMAAHKFADAVFLADRLRYNLARSRGALSPETLAAADLLASLHVAGDPTRPADTRRPDRAAAVYEGVLRAVEAADGGDVGKLRPTAERYLGHLREVCEGAGGEGALVDRSELGDLCRRLAGRLGMRVDGPEKWTRLANNATKIDTLRMYVAPNEWRLGDGFVGQQQVAAK